MPTVVNPSSGDTLCGLAIAAGFLDCDPIRNEPANAGKDFLNRDLLETDEITIPDLKTKQVDKASETKSKFTKKNAPAFGIRLTHGSRNKPFREDPTSLFLNVSNWPTDKGGATAQISFPTATAFNESADVDPDTFKVEIVDPGASGKPKAVLRALRPTFAADGTISGFEAFTGAEADRRKLEVECEQVHSKVCFRSAYLRLVVDDKDHKAAEKQTLIVTDLADGNEGDNDKLEILDQKVEAAYERQKCNGSKKCTARFSLSLGEDHKRVKVAVHILRDPAGNPIGPIPQARKRVLNYVRQLYAQADVSVKFVTAIREIPLPSNLLAIANAAGKRAVGGKSIKVRIRVDAAVDVTASIQTVNGVKPIDTANQLAQAINALLPAGVATVTASENPPIDGQAIGSADILIGDPLTQAITLNVIDNADAGHPVSVGALTSTTVAEFGDSDSHVGTIEERVLIKNYDTGADRVDLFLVGKIGKSLGEAFTPNFKSAVTKRPLDIMVNSAVIFSGTITKDDFFHTTIPHEIGHLLMDGSHADVATEMMGAGSPVGHDERVVNGPKRISDPRRIHFDNDVTGDPVTMLRNDNTNLLDSF